MQRWEAAARRYRLICPAPSEALLPEGGHRLRVWLQDDVVPVLQEIVDQLRFQDLATYSRRIFDPNAQSDERRLVQRVEASLISAARAILDHPLVAGASVDAVNQESLPRGGTVTTQDRNVETATPAIASPSRSESLRPKLDQVRSIANKDWDYLVNVEDYFFTRQEFMEVGGAWLQRGNMINSMNTRLLPIGDLITRGLRERIESRVASLESLTRHFTVHQLNSTAPEAFAELSQAKRQLDESVRGLEASVFAHSEAGLRDSCVAITQTYAALHPSPHLDWLGLSGPLYQEARRKFPSVLTGYRGAVIHDRIASALQHMGQLYDGLDPRVSKLEQAIATGRLVIDIASQSVWWEKRELDLGPGGKNFEFLEALARKSRLRQSVSADDLYPDNPPSDSTMANRWNRLGKKLPGSLAVHVKAISGRAYRLDLDVTPVIID